jgi:hypothetical protein
MEMEPLVARYREWLEERQRPSMPLWITECGRPWKRGPKRPPADQDAQSALDITMKAVEARACGIARYFAFVYPYYDENENNFGMMDRRATPLRSMAAYAQAARTLADAEFLGDLKTADKAVLRSRVFGKGAETIAVVYTGKPDPAAKVKLDLPVLRAEGIDGRPIPAAAGGFLSVPDGLAYLWLDQRAAASRLDPKVPAMRLWERGRQPFERLRKPSPVVLRYQFDRQQAEPSARGYRLKAAPVGKLRVPVKAFNVGDEPVKLDLRLDVDGGQPVASPAGPLAVPSGGAAETAWEVDLAAAFARRGRAWIRVEASDAAAPGAEHRRGPPALAFELFDEANLQATLSQFPGRPQLPIQDLDRWKPAVSGNAAAQGPRSSR